MNQSPLRTTAEGERRTRPERGPQPTYLERRAFRPLRRARFRRLAGPIALLKFQATRTAWKIADDTVQILGGRGITRSGMGAKA